VLLRRRHNAQDQWRSVTIDDRIPVDLFGRPLLVGVRPLQLWPLLLSKALLKVRAVGGGVGGGWQRWQHNEECSWVFKLG
jgi:hypothetical protein